MNYIGSKFSLLDFIENSIKSVNSSLDDKIFCDFFAADKNISLSWRCRNVADFM